ncbi:MAG TPA: hypothetical protein VGD53_07720 [Actinoallomurus sp.]|jgi:hypothetical protein
MDTDLLVEELAAVRGELTRVDTKASMLLALAAGGMAVVATTDRHDLPAGLLVDAGMVTMGLALLVLLGRCVPASGRGLPPSRPRHRRWRTGGAGRL